jgi:hypothetical protein
LACVTNKPERISRYWTAVRSATAIIRDRAEAVASWRWKQLQKVIDPFGSYDRRLAAECGWWHKMAEKGCRHRWEHAQQPAGQRRLFRGAFEPFALCHEPVSHERHPNR